MSDKTNRVTAKPSTLQMWSFCKVLLKRVLRESKIHVQENSTSETSINTINAILLSKRLSVCIS